MREEGGGVYEEMEVFINEFYVMKLTSWNGV